MFLSQLSLAKMNSQVMRILSDVYRLHKAVMSGYAAYPDGLRVLFRVEPEVMDGIVRVLIQSEVEPSWVSVPFQEKGVVEIRIKEFVPRFYTGDILRFRLRANPTVTRNGKRYGLIRDESLGEWLRRKEEKLGVHFRSLSVVDEGYVIGNKTTEDRRFPLNLKTTRYEGYLTVMDPNLLRKTLAEGIGPAKAFGCGLLSLAKR